MFSVKRVSTNINLLKVRVINSLRCLSEYDLWYDQDPSPLFMDNETQSILKSVTQYRLDKIFHNSLAFNCGVEYKLMTNLELNEKLQSVKEFARRKFQMIPVVKNVLFSGDEKLIQAVRGNKCLYDLQDGQYKNMLFKEKIWKSIGESLNVDAEICKRRWWDLRDTHKRMCRKRYAASGSAASVPSKNWKFAEQMSFLENVQQHRSTICNIEDAEIEIEGAEDPGYLAPSPHPPSSPSMPCTQNVFTRLSVTPEKPSPTPSGSSGLPTRRNRRIMMSDEKTHTIFCDPSLKGFSEARFIISDVTYALNQSLRTVITRQTSGNLEHVSMNTSKRVNQLYFPLNGRQIETPFMLKGEYLEKCLNDKKYEFVLDRLIVQFEPYEREFHDISGKVYIHINKTGQFDILRSTRHFGPMAFFLAWHKCIDDLLYDMIKRNYIKNCVEIIALMYKLHGIEKDYKSIMLQFTEIQNTLDIGINNIQNYFSPGRVPTSINDNIDPPFSKPSNKILERCIRFIDDYINQHSFKKNQLELSLQTFKDVIINQHI